MGPPNCWQTVSILNALGFGLMFGLVWIEVPMSQRRALSGPALNQLYGGHGNFIAWAGQDAEPPEAPVAGVVGSAARQQFPTDADAPVPNPSIATPAAKETSDALRIAAALVPDITQGHHTFTRVLTLRLTEVRELRDLWVGPGGLEALLVHVCETCHESVAADVLHALASCRGVCSISEGGETNIQLVGGFPRWSWPHFASVSWLASVAPVLETLLFSVVEDYLATATAAVGHVQEALGGLWGIASRCTSRDLRLGGVADEDGSGGSEPDDSAVGGEECRHAAAVQALEAVRLTSPLLAALRHASQYRGRIQKAALARLEGLLEMHDAVDALVTAAAAAPAPWI